MKRLGIMLLGTLIVAACLLFQTPYLLATTTDYAPQPEKTPPPKVSWTLGADLSAPFDWYLYQGPSGTTCTRNCGPTSVAMAIRFARNNQAVSVDDIRAYMTGDQCTDTTMAQIRSALTHWNVSYSTIAGMQAVSEAINVRNHIVIVPLLMSDIPASANDYDDYSGNSDPANHFNRYCSMNDYHHILVAKGISSDNNWVIVHDPNVWDGNLRYWYTGNIAKGKSRYYDYSHFSTALSNNGNEAIEILGGSGNTDAWDSGDNSGGGAAQLNSPTVSEQWHGPHVLSSSDQYDWFKVYLNAGSTYNFNTTGGSGDDYGELYSDSNGSNRVAYSDDDGGNYQFSFNYTAASSAWYYLRVRAYSVGSACSYTLKYRLISTGGGQPDLVVDNITFTPSNPAVNQAVQITVRIRNQGTGTAFVVPSFPKDDSKPKPGPKLDNVRPQANFYLDLYADHQPTGCADYASINYWTINGLAAGASQDLTFSYGGFSSAGTHNLYAFVDSGCSIGESNDSNNTRGPVPVTVSSSNDTWDPGDNTGSGATQLNAPTSGEQSHGPHTLSSSDQYDWFKVYLNAGSTYNFNTAGGSGDDYGELYSDSNGGNRVAYSDDDGGNYQFSFNYTAASSAWYYLRVRAYSVGSACSYTLKYRLISTGGQFHVVEALSLSTTSPVVGENVRARFRVRNDTGQTIVLQELAAGARRGSDWNGEEVDFPHANNITLQNGQEYTYEQWRTFSTTGGYFAEPVVKINGSWGGIAGANRVNFTVGQTPPSDVIVDERDSGFSKGGSYWQDDWSLGYSGHMYWTCVNGNVVDSWGEWHPNLPAARAYEVYVYIPNFHTNTNGSRYEIHHRDGVTTITRAQQPYSDQWVSLGTFNFNAGTGGYVRLTDATGEAATCNTQIGFDALKWSPR